MTCTSSICLIVCMLRLAIHVQSRRCQFSIVKDPNFGSGFFSLKNFSFGCNISPTRLLAGASPTLLCAAEDAIRELTENWEPPPEGAGCIYQPLCCAQFCLGGIKQCKMPSNFEEISRIIMHNIVHCLVGNIMTLVDQICSLCSFGTWMGRCAPRWVERLRECLEPALALDAVEREESRGSSWLG